MKLPLPADSIRFRLLALSALLVGGALVAGYLTIAAILEDFITGRFDDDMRAVTETIIAEAAPAEDGTITLARPPADPRFELPLSGWYWQLTENGTAIAKSPSLYDHVLTEAASDQTGRHELGPNNQPLRVDQTSFTLPDTDARFTVIVSAPANEIQAKLSQVRRPLAISLVILGLGLALASILQVTAGLKSLGQLSRDIRRIRAGEAEALPVPAVAELRPISTEINGLLDQNKAVLNRSREYVGNLAHSLKTPLAALSNSLPPEHQGTMLVERMDRQIGWHLRRARSSAAARVLGQRTPVRAVIDDILLVLDRPIDDAGIKVEVSCPPTLSFAGERQDLEEMIGNLTENAVKWAIGKIRIRAMPDGSDTDHLIFTVEDDGPGMSDADYATATERGGRLDEYGPPGTGLGLAIVVDLAALHGGRLSLGRSELGGLRAELILPA